MMESTEDQPEVITSQDEATPTANPTEGSFDADGTKDADTNSQSFVTLSPPNSPGEWAWQQSGVPDKRQLFDICTTAN